MVTKAQLKSTEKKLSSQHEIQTEKFSQHLTSPCAPIQLDPHTNGPWMSAVRYDPDLLSDDRRFDLTKLGDVRVAVAREYLKKISF